MTNNNGLHVLSHSPLRKGKARQKLRSDRNREAGTKTEALEECSHESYMEMKCQWWSPVMCSVPMHSFSIVSWDSTCKIFQQYNYEALQEGTNEAFYQILAPLSIVLCRPMDFTYSNSWPESIGPSIGKHCLNSVYGLHFCNIKW